ncbi:hypothetical protein [Kitasatospora arboriphila]|uniref:SAM-dependent methyltransferase n=1 Tax=Kitasatospora arboriphila TaxID=258052 RepID=A0ABP4E318_9ACTN
MDQTRPAPTAVRSGRTRTVAGQSTVPLSVWLTEPLTGCCPACEGPADAACANRLPLGLARQVTEAFSAPSDLVYVPEAGNAACLIAPVQARRKVLAFAPTNPAAARAYDTLRENAAEVASLAVLRRGAPGSLPSGADRAGGRARLAIAAPHHGATPAALAALAESCARALQPGGILVTASRQSAGQDACGHLVAHAQAAGLAYLQHIAAVEATAADGRLVPATAAPAQHGPDCACRHARPGAGRHALIHSDLLVFTKP